MSAGPNTSNDAIVRNSTDVIDGEGDLVAASLMPGHLVARDADGGILPHNVAGGPAIPEFADLPIDPAKTITDPYTDGERVNTAYCPPGVEVNALLAPGATVDGTTFVVSNGDGTLRPYDSVGGDNPGNIVGRAVEAVTADAAEPARFRVVVK